MFDYQDQKIISHNQRGRFTKRVKFTNKFIQLVCSTLQVIAIPTGLLYANDKNSRKLWVANPFCAETLRKFKINKKDKNKDYEAGF